MNEETLEGELLQQEPLEGELPGRQLLERGKSGRRAAGTRASGRRAASKAAAGTRIFETGDPRTRAVGGGTPTEPPLETELREPEPSCQGDAGAAALGKSTFGMRSTAKAIRKASTGDGFTEVGFVGWEVEL